MNYGYYWLSPWDSGKAMQQMMFGDLEIPSAGRVRWLWPGTAVGSSADHRWEPNSTENFSCFIEKHLKNQKTKPRANKKQDQKKHTTDKKTQKKQRNTQVLLLLLFIYFFWWFFLSGCFLVIYYYIFFLLKSIFSVETGALNLGFLKYFGGTPIAGWFHGKSDENGWFGGTAMDWKHM
jgi:hypothetical protein